MKQQWERLEAWLKTHNPALLDDLKPPASDVDIQELEQKLGVRLPEDFVECLKMHDGQKGGANGCFPVRSSCRQSAFWKSGRSGKICSMAATLMVSKPNLGKVSSLSGGARSGFRSLTTVRVITCASILTRPARAAAGR
ncbi:SMI1/KNR4 family protein [Stutzerimonas stutzeri]|nr:SMI1/KNR4 family protein [Stutzerimonas stutzeri]UVO16607.1 SMI1/KNR4 family protein [Stutzerimonas stutzeri]